MGKDWKINKLLFQTDKPKDNPGKTGLHDANLIALPPLEF